MVMRLLPPGWRVLDLCCGTGLLTRALAKSGRTAIGVDADAERIALGRRLWPTGTLVCEDVLTFLEHDETYYDAICCFDGLEHIAPAKRDRFYDLLDARTNLATGILAFNIPNFRFLDWLRLHDPSKLDPIDTAPAPSALISALRFRGFDIRFLECYSVEASDQYYFLAFQRPVTAWHQPSSLQ